MRAEHVLLTGSYARVENGVKVRYEAGAVIQLEQHETEGLLAGRVRRVEDTPPQRVEEQEAIMPARRRRGRIA